MMKVYLKKQSGQRGSEQGYIMLTLLLIVALMIIFAAAIAPSIAFDIKRDREAEMIHRGCQYSRAIRAYYRKFGRYPVKIEDLENTQNLRFLRQRYKDPENCKNGKCADFKLLHFGEVQMALSMGGGAIPGATPVSQMGQGNGQSAFGQSSTFGSSTFGSSSSSFGSSSSSFGSSSSSFGSSSTTSFGQNQQNQTASNAASDSTPSQAQTSPDGTTVNSSGSNASSDSNSSAAPQIIGGPIIGVASLSKEKTIREYNKKKTYKEWAFVYDPTLDQGLLITTPYQPTLQSFNTQNNLNGQSGQNQNGQNGSSTFGNGVGSGNGFGSSFGNSGTQNPSTNGGFGQPSNPTPPQQQQQ